MNPRQLSLRDLLLLVTIAGVLLGGAVWLAALEGPARDTVFKVLFYVLLALPFLLVAMLAWTLARSAGRPRAGRWLFILSTLALGLNLYWGYSASGALAAQKAWTGAALTLAMTIPRGFVVAFVAAIARWLLGRGKRKSEP
ncbi:MAG: hypothetical protein AB7O59_22875 [Pirellulales bacterium]